jgi:hypothetical protein
MPRKAPTPVGVSVTLDGVTYRGTYYVQASMVHVQCNAGTKTTQLGGFPAQTIAKMLLSELVRSGLKKKPGTPGYV